MTDSLLLRLSTMLKLMWTSIPKVRDVFCHVHILNKLTNNQQESSN